MLGYIISLEAVLSLLLMVILYIFMLRDTGLQVKAEGEVAVPLDLTIEEHNMLVRMAIHQIRVSRNTGQYGREFTDLLLNSYLNKGGSFRERLYSLGLALIIMKL